jgi:hypothetical protein
MTKELKDKWCAALRSGEYEQGKLMLKKLNKQGETVYCCLGVLREIEPKAKAITTNDGDSNAMLIKFPGLDESTLETLTIMNDDGHSFTKIADWIESNVHCHET